MQPATFTKSSFGLKRNKTFIPLSASLSSGSRVQGEGNSSHVIWLCSMFLMSQQLDGYDSPAHVPLQQTKVLLSFPTDAKICHVILLPARPKEKVIILKMMTMMIIQWLKQNGARIEYTPHDPHLDWQLGTTLQHNDPVEKSQSVLKEMQKKNVSNVNCYLLTLSVVICSNLSASQYFNVLSLLTEKK